METRASMQNRMRKHLASLLRRRLVLLDKFYLLVCTTQFDKFSLDKEPCSKAGHASFYDLRANVSINIWRILSLDL